MLPNLLGLLLSVIHSQIAATGDGNSAKPPVRLRPKRRQSSRKSLKNKTARRYSFFRKPSSDLHHHNNLCHFSWSSTSSKIEQRRPINGSTFNVHRTLSSNCPPKLRKKNVEWDHIYSPYWSNRNSLESNLELNQKQNGEETIAESERSERSNVDHGFESFNGKSSSGNESGTPTRVS